MKIRCVVVNFCGFECENRAGRLDFDILTGIESTSSPTSATLDSSTRFRALTLPTDSVTPIASQSPGSPVLCQRDPKPRRIGKQLTRRRRRPDATKRATQARKQREYCANSGADFPDASQAICQP